MKLLFLRRLLFYSTIEDLAQIRPSSIGIEAGFIPISTWSIAYCPRKNSCQIIHVNVKCSSIN